MSNEEEDVTSIGFRCGNCTHQLEDHPDGFCLFQPTKYRQMTEKEGWAYLATLAPAMYDLRRRKLKKGGT